MADVNNTPVLDQEGLDKYNSLIKDYINTKVDGTLSEVESTLTKLVFGGLPATEETVSK